MCCTFPAPKTHDWIERQRRVSLIMFITVKFGSTCPEKYDSTHGQELHIGTLQAKGGNFLGFFTKICFVSFRWQTEIIQSQLQESHSLENHPGNMLWWYCRWDKHATHSHLVSRAPKETFVCVIPVHCVRACTHWTACRSQLLWRTAPPQPKKNRCWHTPDDVCVLRTDQLQHLLLDQQKGEVLSRELHSPNKTKKNHGLPAHKPRLSVGACGVVLPLLVVLNA